MLSKATNRMRFVPWAVLLHELTARWDLPGTGPAVEVLERDLPSDLQLVAVAGHRYWIPSRSDPEQLKKIWIEIFNPRHPHQYQYGGCRLRADDAVVDAGACEGSFTRLALQQGARVVAVEPWSVMAEALRRTFAKEIASGSVQVRQCVLSAESGRATLRFNPHWPFGATAADSPGGVPNPCSEEVEMTTVDALVKASPWERCDFIKMDIEGAERAALAGAVETLGRDWPRLSLTTYHRLTDYLSIRSDIRALGLGYRVVGKGLTKMLEGIWRPVMLHAWVPGR